MLDHQLDELLEGGGLRIPAEFGLGFGRVAPEVHYIGRAVEVFGDSDYGAADKVGVGGAGNGDDDTLLVDTLTFPAELDAGVVEGQGCEFADGVLNAGCNHEVLRLVVLEYEPHTLHIVLGIAPVAEGVEVAEVEAVLLALGDASGGESDLAGHEGLATALALVVEEDAGATEHVVGLAVLLDNPEAVELGYGVW